MSVTMAMPVTVAEAVAPRLDRTLAARRRSAADDACRDERQDHQDQRDDGPEDEGAHCGRILPPTDALREKREAEDRSPDVQDVARPEEEEAT